MKVLKGILFWIWSFIWGLPLTLAGCLVALFLLITGHKPHHHHYFVYFSIVNDNWGGLELGPFFLTDKKPSDHVKEHECGHGLQNLIFGPLMPFVVTFPSGFRYWFREMRSLTAKRVYIGVVTLIFAVIGGGLTACGFIFGWMAMWIPGLCVLAYGEIITIWQIMEYPKYKKFPQPYYDDFWAEGVASKWGHKHYPATK